jgi:penicillin amidase
MKKGIRTIVIIASVIAGLCLIIGGVWLSVSHRPFPKTRGTINVEGLSAPVEIYRDIDGIPHIYADTMEDLFFAQGFVHAQDRFWQMEFYRRVGSGRLAELFGEAVLGVDIYIRTVGFRQIAETEFDMLDMEVKKLIEAYAAGVNAYISSRKPQSLGLEFTLLKLQGHELEVEPWTPVDTILWGKIMAEDLSSNMADELFAIDVIRAVGLELADDFFPDYREKEMPYHISDGEFAFPGKQQKSSDSDASAKEEAELFKGLNTRLVGGYDPLTQLAFGKGEGVGSNCWALSGTLTASGKPLLANDQHLAIQIPSLWYEVGLHSKKGGGAGRDEPFNARGFSLPGAPGIIMGHNDHIAWGITAMYADVQDLYIERINPYNPNQYEVNGEWVDMNIRREEINVYKQDEPYVLLVRGTRHGPIITDHGDMMKRNSFDIIPRLNFPDNLELKALSLRWSSLKPTESLSFLITLNRAQNYEDFRKAMSLLKFVPINIVYADIHGNIAYQAPGLIPLRAKGDGSIPAPGWIDDYEWKGYIPFEELPWVLNPQKGYIVSANNPVVTDKYPYLIAKDFDHGYRARRIVDMIEGKASGFSVEDMRSMQGDNLCLSALEILPYLKDLTFEDKSIESVRDRLLEWNGRMEMDSAEAALYGYFWVALVEKLFHDQIPDHLWNKENALGASSRLLSCVHNLLQEPGNRWWDDVTTLDKKETRDEILIEAFMKGYNTGVEELGEKLDQWQWGDIHTATFRDQTFGQSGIGLIESIFNRGPVATSGGLHQVNRSDFTADKPFEVYHASTMRQVIDFGKLSNSLMIHTTGQSGHPGNRHYDDFIDPWRLIEYHPTRWEKQTVEADSKRKLILEPL